MRGAIAMTWAITLANAPRRLDGRCQQSTRSVAQKGREGQGIEGKRERGKKSARRTEYQPDTEDGRVDQPYHADRRRVRVHERRARRRIL